MNIGITGMSGFIGTHLVNTLLLNPNEYNIIQSDVEYFNSKEKLKAFVTQCDVIIHLAAINRHNDPDVLYQTNIDLVKKLVEAMENTGSIPHVLFASSIQEELGNKYGKSKEEGRKIFENWAKNNNSRFTALIIPNVFGPFGDPYYNSVIATFCHQLTHDEQPIVDVDSEIKLIYIDDLISEFINCFKCDDPVDNAKAGIECVLISSTMKIKVSELLKVIIGFKENYYEKGVFPDLNDKFIRDLFNTFICYIDHSNWLPFDLSQHSDQRGSFVETMRFNSGGQVSFSITFPGITRGNHYHTRKVERFAVIAGKARIEIRRIDTKNILRFILDGNSPSFVDMPIWYTHNITNIGDEDLYTLFWINETFNPDDPDTYFEEV